MPVRIIQPEEALACRKLQSIAFVNPLDTAQLEKEPAETPPHRYLGFFNEENVLTACIGLPEYQVRYEEGFVRMTGLGGVASLPEYRFGGAIRQTVYAAFRLMREEGAVFSCLYPFSHPYYRQFGYELCQLSPSYTLPVNALKKFSCSAKVRMLLPGEGLDKLQAVFDAHFRCCNLAVRREARHWKKLTGSDPYKERVYTYLLEGEEGPRAYLIFSAKDTGDHEHLCQVKEIAFTGPQGLTDALGFLYRLSAQYPALRLSLPEHIPLPALIDECYEIKPDFDSYAMARLIHLQKALERKRHPEGAGYILHVLDEVIPENDGFFQVRCQNGRVSAGRVEAAAADLTADIRTMAQLLLGFIGIDEAAYKPDVQIAGQPETLRAVFVKRPVYLTDHF